MLMIDKLTKFCQKMVSASQFKIFVFLFSHSNTFNASNMLSYTSELEGY